jgi:hypothetical protein
MGSSSGRNEWFKIFVKQVLFLFVSGYPPPNAWITQAYQGAAALLAPIAHFFRVAKFLNFVLRDGSDEHLVVTKDEVGHVVRLALRLRRVHANFDRKPPFLQDGR